MVSFSVINLTRQSLFQSKDSRPPIAGLSKRSHTANEGPVTNVWFPFMYSQKCSCAFSLFPKQNHNNVSQFLHSYICERFIYFKDRFFCCSQICDHSWEYINRSQTHECRIGIEAAQFLFRKYINSIFVTVRVQPLR
jgi:hypothetical protein